MFDYIIQYIKNILGSPNENQFRIFLFSFFAVTLTSSIVMAMPLFFQEPNLICQSLDRNNIPYSCKQSEACSSNIISWIDYTTSPMSVVTEYELICDKSKYINYIGSLMYFLVGAGNIYFTFFSKDDQKLRLCHNICIICGLLLCIIYFLNSPLFILALLSIYDFLFMIFCLVPYVIIANISADNQKFRSWAISLVNSGWGFCQIYTGIMGYIYFNWKFLIAFYIGLPLLILAYIYRDLPSRVFISNIQAPNISINHESIFKIFSYPSLRSFLIYSMIAVLVRCMGYYGTNYVMGTLIGNIYMNQMCLGLIEIVGYISCGYITANFPRKLIIKLCFFVNGFAFFMFAILAEEKSQAEPNILIIIINLGFILIGKLVLCINVACSAVWFTEVLPNSVRHVGFGIICAIGRIFVVFLPQFIWIMQKLGINPFLGFSLLSAIGYYCISGFPETFGRPIEEYPIEEIEMKKKAIPLLIADQQLITERITQ